MVRAGVFFYQSIFVLFIITLVLIINKSRLKDIGKFICLVWSCYFILHFTIFDYPIGGKIATYMFPKYKNIGALMSSFNFIPFRTVINCYSCGIRTFIVQIMGNICLFIPLGITGAWIFSRKRVFFQALFPVLVSVLVEIMQIILDILNGMVIKSFDIDDILLNGVGGVFGVLAFKILCNFIRRIRTVIKG